MKIVLVNINDEWYFRIITKDDELLATSPPFKLRQDCLDRMRFVKWRMVFAEIVEED